MATTKPAANKAAHALRLTGEMPEEGDEAGRGSACSGVSVGFSSRSKSVNMARARKWSATAHDASRGAVKRCDPAFLYRIGGGA